VHRYKASVRLHIHLHESHAVFQHDRAFVGDDALDRPCPLVVEETLGFIDGFVGHLVSRLVVDR
jgi:hypothetical protein